MRHEVHRHHALDLLHLRLVEISHYRDTDVVDPSAKRRELFSALARCRQNLAVGRIASDHVMTSAELPARLLGVLRVDLDTNGVPAVGRQPRDDRAANAGADASDDDACGLHSESSPIFILASAPRK
jgi:hypothetical protein